MNHLAHVCFEPFTEDFPRADIYELIAPDILHQLIKGTFKDHLVTWAHEYLDSVHGASGAKVILDDIDKRFVGLSIGFYFAHSLPEFPLSPHSLGCVVFPKAEASNSGRVTIPRP